MRGSLVGGCLLLLQVPVSVYSLPIPLQAQNEIDSVPAQHTFGLPTHTHSDVRVLYTPDEEDGLADGEFSLEQELAELQRLRAQLVKLGREVSTRERWLAEAAGRSTTPSSLTDCGSLRCLVQTVFRKAKHAVSAILNTEAGNPIDDSDQRTAVNRTIPLPPWRQTPPHDDDSNSRNSTTPPAEDDLPLVITLTPAIPLLLVVVLACLSRLLGCGRVNGEDDHAGSVPVLPVHAPLGTSGARREEQPRWWRGLWERILRVRRGTRTDGGVRDGFGSDSWRREGGWSQERLEAGEGHGRGVEEDEYRDEKGFLLDGDRTLMVDDGDGEEEEDEEEEEEVRSEGGSDSGQEEELTLGEELASFRAALDLVEGLVAAGERRERGREG